MGESPHPRTRRITVVARALFAVYVSFLLIAAWPGIVRPARFDLLTQSVRRQVLGRVGIQPGVLVFWAPPELQRWWPVERCLEISAHMDDGAARVARFACPPSGTRMAWNPVDSMLYLWLIVSRSSSGRPREQLFGAGVDWFCRNFDGGVAVRRIRVETVEQQIDYETGARREQRSFAFEGDCGKPAAG